MKPREGQADPVSETFLGEPAPSLTDEERAALGANLAAIAEETSLEVALKLSEHLGGRHWEIPKRPSPSSPLIKAVGEEAARTICERFGGGGSKLYVLLRPGKRLEMRILRNRLGWSIASIAAHLRCSERSVYRVLGEDDDRQLPLW